MLSTGSVFIFLVSINLQGPSQYEALCHEMSQKPYVKRTFSDSGRLLHDGGLQAWPHVEQHVEKPPPMRCGRANRFTPFGKIGDFNNSCVEDIKLTGHLLVSRGQPVLLFGRQELSVALKLCSAQEHAVCLHHAVI